MATGQVTEEDASIPKPRSRPGLGRPRSKGTNKQTQPKPPAKRGRGRPRTRVGLGRPNPNNIRAYNKSKVQRETTDDELSSKKIKLKKIRLLLI